MISVRVTQPHSSDLSLDQKLCLKRSNGSFEVLCLLSDLTVDNGEQSQYFKPDVALSVHTTAGTMLKKIGENTKKTR